MARKKVNLQWISNNSTRRATYRRRCQNLMKKTGELVTLCGVKAAVVAYGGEGEPAAAQQPDTWPTAAEARRVCTKFQGTPDVGSLKKSVTQESFLAARVKTLREQVRRMDLENRRREAALLLDDRLNGERVGLGGTTSDELVGLMDLVDKKIAGAQDFADRQLKEVEEQARAVQAQQQQEQAAEPELPPPPPPLAAQQVHPEPPPPPPPAQQVHVAHPELAPPPALPPSPAQMQQPDSPLFTCSDLQSLAPLEGPQPLQQEDLLADTAMNDADLSSAAFLYDNDDDFTFPIAGSSGGDIGFKSVWDR